MLPFAKWAMLGSNQRPPPCKRSATVFWRLLEFAKFLQKPHSPTDSFSQYFRIFA
jgi:hypothetical protein